MTQQSVHQGPAEQLRNVRQAVLDEAFHATPNRYKGRRPEPQALPTAVWINPPPQETINPKSSQPCAVNS
jgi:putative transposase